MINKICFDKVCFGYEAKENKTEKKYVFKDLSFTIEKPHKKGHIVGLLGGSGSGKTTLFKLLLGIEEAWSGNICFYANNNIEDSPVISYVPQEPVLFEHLTPKDNSLYFSKTVRFKDLFHCCPVKIRIIWFNLLITN